MAKNEKSDVAGPAQKKRNSGDTKGYAEESPGRHDVQSGKAAQKDKSAEEIGTTRKKTVR